MGYAGKKTKTRKSNRSNPVVGTPRGGHRNHKAGNGRQAVRSGAKKSAPPVSWQGERLCPCGTETQKESLGRFWANPRDGGVPAVDFFSVFFSAIALFENQPFPRGFCRFSRKKLGSLERMEMEDTSRGVCFGFVLVQTICKGVPSQKDASIGRPTDQERFRVWFWRYGCLYASNKIVTR